MDNFAKGMTVAAALVVIAAGSHYLWKAAKFGVADKCKQDALVLRKNSYGFQYGVRAPEYLEAMQACIDRGYPIR